MSHFSVVIIGDDVDGQMAPYQENNMGDCPKEYLKFNDVEEELLKEYRTGSTTKVKTPDGRLLWLWDEEFRVPRTFGTGRNTHKTPDDCVEVELPYTELYSTFEEYAKDYEGYHARDEDMGRFGRWENLNAKWDYFSIGGRWSGYFPLKPGGVALSVPKKDWDSPRDLGINTTDQARFSDIDFDRARDEAEAKARSTFAKWRACFTEHNKAESRKSIIERVCGTGDAYSSAKLDEAREIYNSQPAIKSFCKHLDWSGEPVSDIGYDEEVYVQRERNRALVPYAAVKDGKWYQKGEMGWWGVSFGEVSQEEWNKNFYKLFEGLLPETVITVVDCHN